MVSCCAVLMWRLNGLNTHATYPWVCDWRTRWSVNVGSRTVLRCDELSGGLSTPSTSAAVPPSTREVSRAQRADEHGAVVPRVLRRLLCPACAVLPSATCTAGRRRPPRGHRTSRKLRRRGGGRLPGRPAAAARARVRVAGRRRRSAAAVDSRPRTVPLQRSRRQRPRVVHVRRVSQSRTGEHRLRAISLRSRRQRRGGGVETGCEPRHQLGAAATDGPTRRRVNSREFALVYYALAALVPHAALCFCLVRPVPNVFLSLCTILYIFRWNSRKVVNTMHEQIKWLHFGRNWNMNKRRDTTEYWNRR